MNAGHIIHFADHQIRKFYLCIFKICKLLSAEKNTYVQAPYKLHCSFISGLIGVQYVILVMAPRTPYLISELVQQQDAVNIVSAFFCFHCL